MIEYVNGDATNPLPEHSGKNGFMLPHLCNNCGVMGSGIALTIKEKWPGAYDAYLEDFKRCKDDNEDFLGSVSFYTKNFITIANLVGQNGFGPPWHDRVSYEHLKIGLNWVYQNALVGGLNVVMPKIGSMRAGGSWNRIEKMINETMSVATYVYLFEENK